MNKELQDGTVADSSTPAQVTTSSQPCTKPSVMRCSNGHDFFQKHILMQDTLVERGRNGDIIRERDYICPICKVKIDTPYVVCENIA